MSSPGNEHRYVSWRRDALRSLARTSRAAGLLLLPHCTYSKRTDCSVCTLSCLVGGERRAGGWGTCPLLVSVSWDRRADAVCFAVISVASTARR